MRALFATAVEDGAIRSNPAAGLRIANAATDDEGDEVKALTEDELRRVVEKLPVAWRFFFEFLAQTGLRIGEAIELRWADVDGGRPRVCRRYYCGAVGLPKGRKKRDVPLTRDLAQALWARRKELHAKADDLVFTSAKGLRIDPSNLMDRVLKPAPRAADVGDLGHVPHLPPYLRDDALSGSLGREDEDVRGRLDAVQVQKFLGHSDPGFTLTTYVHLLPEDLPEPSFTSVSLPSATEHPTADDSCARTTATISTATMSGA